MRGGGWIVSQLPLVAQHPDATLQAAGLLSFEGRPMSTQPHVVIVGGGFGGNVLGLLPPAIEVPEGAIEVRPGPGARLLG